MNEVSCRAIDCVVPLLEAHGIPMERVLEGLSVSAEHLRDPTQRIDWDINVAVVQRTVRLVGPGATDEMGRLAVQAPPFNLFRLIGLVMADSRFLYRMGMRWMGPSLFSHLRFGLSELPDGRLRLEVEIPKDYQGCTEMLEAFGSSFRFFPRLLGRGEAEVQAEISSHLGVFTVRAPRRASFVGWLRVMLRLPGAARATVEAVVREQSYMNRALTEVRRAHAELSSQVEHLATLDRLGRALSKELGSEQIPDRILQFLNRRFGWRGSSLSVHAGNGDGLLFFGQSGTTGGSASYSYPLIESGHELGRLEVWSEAEFDSEESEQQLEKLLPWIAMTVTNARLAAGARSNGEPSALRWSSKTGRDLFLVLDASTRILYAGPRVDEILGYEAEELQRMRVAELIHPDDRPRLAREIGNLAKYTSSAFCSSARLRMQDGAFRRMEGVAIKVLSESGASVYLVSCGAEGESGPSH